MPIAYIGIGSNLGNREENCRKAVQLLSASGITVTKQSLMYETEPWGIKDQPKFINTAIEILTKEEPRKLLKTLKKIEENLGRQETCRWGPRIVDLDILFYEDLIINDSDLRIPHPHMQEREFVLRPLSEIAPDKIHPVLKKTVSELLQSCTNSAG